MRKPTRQARLQAGRDDLAGANRKALIIGVEYGSRELYGVRRLSAPHKDARDFQAHLIRRWGYKRENTTLMLDKLGHPSNLQPTKANILAQIDKLVRNARAGDRLVFYFAGHGYQLVSHDPHEPDGRDEAILAMDHHGEPVDQNGDPLDPENILDEHRVRLDGLIVDNELHDHLVAPLNSDASLVSIFDTCHSGTLLDLTHQWINKAKQTLLPTSPRSPKGDQVHPISLKRRPTKRHTGGPARGFAKLNHHPPTRSSSAPHRAPPPLLPAIPTIVFTTDNLDMPQCSSPTESEFIRTDEDDGDGEIITVPHRNGRAKDRCEEHSFQQATLSPVPSASSQTSSARSSPYVLSIAPAEDHQAVFEASATDSRSFTSSLINVLDDAEPGISHKEFMERLRFHIFMGVTKSLLKLYKKKRRSLGDTFHRQRRWYMDQVVPSPQIGSTQQLDLNTEFRLS